MTNEEKHKLLDAVIGASRDNMMGGKYYKAYESGVINAYNRLVKEIKELEQTRWIPVSERLPEPNVAVLTYINTGATETYCLAYWNDMLEAWEEWISTDLIEEDKGYKVLAWMPLPEPYKAESEDTE